MEFAASIASADLMHIGDELRRLKEWPHVHFDIEDGNFTPNITFGLSLLRAAAKLISPTRMGLHLMANHPMDLLPELAELGVPRVFAHLEALPFPLLFLNRAKSLGMRAGLALNIQTPLSMLDPFMPAIDEVLVMTAEPDNAGEKLWAPGLDKAVAAARTLPIPVWADGGLTEETIRVLFKAGASGCVLGRAVFNSGDPYNALSKLKKQFEKGNQ